MEKIRITAANKDGLREMAFALNARGASYRKIASRLGIDKNTVQKYIHQEARRRRYDPEAKEMLDDVIASLTERHQLFQRRFIRIQGDGPQSALARLRWNAAIESIEKKLLYLYGIELPETDPEKILEERGRKMASQPLPEGYPELSEQAIVDRHVGDESDIELAERLTRHQQDAVDRFDQKAVEVERLREAKRRLEAEAKERGYSSVEEMLDSDEEEDDGSEYMVRNWDDAADDTRFF